MDVFEELNETKVFLEEKGIGRVDCGIILGTGLAALANEIEVFQSFNYSQIPNFPVATTESHFGRLIYGKLAGKRVLAWQGRFHFYEGHSMTEIVKPVRISGLFGAKAMFISNASGSLNPDFKKGTFMLLDDHINLLPGGPLIGPNIDELGARFPDMSAPYDKRLRQLVFEASEELGLAMNRGVYVSVPGPHLETKAEYRYLRMLGADAVGMSTVPEVIACVHMGIPCCAVSVLTDECDPDTLQPVDINDIIAVARAAEPNLAALMSYVVERVG
jgi:purine-nucleoside phosphorylase